MSSYVSRTVKFGLPSKFYYSDRIQFDGGVYEIEWTEPWKRREALMNAGVVWVLPHLTCDNRTTAHCQVLLVYKEPRSGDENFLGNAVFSECSRQCLRSQERYRAFHDK